MAGERCNLNKDEAEILKPSSSSSPPSHPSPPPAAAPPSSLFLKPPLPQEFPAPERSGRSTESLPSPAADSADAAASAPQQNSEKKSDSPLTAALEPVPFVNRCSSCQKRVGLTGFRCRCGDLFCPRHRHSDTHNCSFDYKAAGKEQIAKANPLIRAAKIIKI